MSNFSLDRKTAVITGGGSGIGKGIALRFASSGAVVYLLDIKEDTFQTVQEIEEMGGQAHWISCDVGNHLEVSTTIDSIQRERRINLLINNAGIGMVGCLTQTTETDLDRLYRVNVKGIYNCMYATIPHLQANGGGVIINMASTLSTVAIKDRFAYSMTKGAVRAMTLSVALDYIHDGIRCNCIAPGRIHTPFVDQFIAKNYPGREDEMFHQLSIAQPIGRMGTPEEIANLVLFLCSEEAGFITGCEYPIDGGFLNLKP